MQYSLTNEEGVILRAASSRPVSYLHGAGTIPAGLEKKLASCRVGDIVRARLLPDDAFGRRDIDLVRDVPLSDIPDAEHIEVGGHLVGTDETGNEVPFTITAISDDTVSLDGNHPLAGQTLIFEVEIQGVREATDTELRSGRISDNQPDPTGPP